MLDDQPKTSDGEDDDELKQALMAAFGDDAMGMLDDDEFEDDDEFSDEFLAAQLLASDASHDENQPSPVENGKPAEPTFSRFNSSDPDDSPRTRWMKELCSSLYCEDAGSQSKSISARHVVIAAGDFQFGIPLEDVREIARCPKVTELPCTPAWLRGVANFRGQVLSVTDLRNLLCLSGRRPVVREMVVVIHSQARNASTALAVDQVLGIRKLSDVRSTTDGLNGEIAKVASGQAMQNDSQVILIDSDLLFANADLFAPSC